ncbi:protein FAM200A-like [Aphis craccivora]|uniref:Protein FAM200A-like n=1 Tax=Aphis craccivora TaxID=307492 RepID=A0A6G0YB84_APHCR|nr:protein FAM200A-like [Aphis craccivora]
MLFSSRRIISIFKNGSTKNGIKKYNMRTFVDTFSKFKDLNTVGIIVLFGSCGEKNIKNANLTSTEKDYLLEISPNTILQPKLSTLKDIEISQPFSHESKIYVQVTNHKYQCDATFIDRN